MGTVIQKLTIEEFEAQYGPGSKTHEYWYGEAIPKGMPTWTHGLLQKILMRLLDDAGFVAASEVELRIDPEAHPKPDVIAVRTKLATEPYPTEGLDVVVEIISPDDRFPSVREHCRKYQTWGFSKIYLVDPADRSVQEWRDGALVPVAELAHIPAVVIWEELDRQLAKSRK